MNTDCQLVVFSDKAYNAIIRETFEWDPVETGGILLGHVLDNGCWIVMEVLPPGYGEGREGDNVYHEYGYFEYNRKFVNYLANSVANQYEIPLQLLGLWHRHPGSMDTFSRTDDSTNMEFALQNPAGVISGLVNIDPQLRLTMYHLSSDDVYMGRPGYQRVEVEVGSDLIPEEYFRLKYYRGEEKELHPYAPQRHKDHFSTAREDTKGGATTSLNSKDIIRRQLADTSSGGMGTYTTDHSPGLIVAEEIMENVKKNKKLILILAALVLVFSFVMLLTDRCSEKTEFPKVQNEEIIDRTIHPGHSIRKEKIQDNTEKAIEIEAEPAEKAKPENEQQKSTDYGN